MNESSRAEHAAARSPAPNAAEAPRSKASIAATRKRELIEAAILSIADNGYSQSSVERITEIVGVSRGLIRHHFQTKALLLEEAYRSIFEEFRDQLDKRSSAASNPVQRLHDWFELTFQPPLARPKVMAAWLAFAQASRTDQGLRRINREVYAWYHEYLQPLIAEAAHERGLALDVRGVTDGLIALMDGLWLELTIDPEQFDPNRSKAICMDYLDRALGVTMPPLCPRL